MMLYGLVILRIGVSFPLLSYPIFIQYLSSELSALAELTTRTTYIANADATQAAHAAHTESHAHGAESAPHVHALRIGYAATAGLAQDLEVIDELLQLLTALCDGHHHVHGYCI